MRPLVFLCLLAAVAHADDEKGPYAYVGAGDGGMVYFKAVPDRSAPDPRETGTVTVFSVDGRSGAETKLYEIPGMWGTDLALSYDGQLLVRLGNWPRGHEPSDQHLAIAFYNKGKLVKSYSTKALIKDPTKVEPSKSHYRYRLEGAGFERWSPRFKLTTVDGVAYTFDARDGSIVK
jgi:hypothetical protein